MCDKPMQKNLLFLMEHSPKAGVCFNKFLYYTLLWGKKCVKLLELRGFNMIKPLWLTIKIKVPLIKFFE